MSLALGFDASTPPLTPYPGSRVAAGYIGGNTPHVWTGDEWRRFAQLYQAPIWVGYLEDDPAGHARDAVARMRSLGWSAGLEGGNTRACILDFETEIDPAWVDAFAIIVRAAGYQTMPYGSQSTIMHDPQRAGRWIALYNDLPVLTGDPAAVGHQFRADVPWSNTQVDLSVWAAEALGHFGQGPRHGN